MHPSLSARMTVPMGGNSGGSDMFVKLVCSFLHITTPLLCLCHRWNSPCDCLPPPRHLASLSIAVM